MYREAICNRNITAKASQPVHFREKEDEKDIPTPSLTVPAVNISETTDAYIITMAVPGLHRDDFSIAINESVITIAAKKETIPSASVNDRCEYDYTDWARAFSLPADADPLLANAVYENGELVIHLPRNGDNQTGAKTTIYVY